VLVKSTHVCSEIQFVMNVPYFFQIIGGVTYALFIAQLIYPNNILLYGASAIIGVGAAIIWTAQVFANIDMKWKDKKHYILKS